MATVATVQARWRSIGNEADGPTPERACEEMWEFQGDKMRP
jgi:hypothetical protein